MNGLGTQGDQKIKKIFSQKPANVKELTKGASQLDKWNDYSEHKH